METIIMGDIGYRIWGIWGSYYTMPKTIFYLLKGTTCRGMQGHMSYSLSS